MSHLTNKIKKQKEKNNLKRVQIFFNTGERTFKNPKDYKRIKKWDEMICQIPIQEKKYQKEEKIHS